MNPQHIEGWLTDTPDAYMIEGKLELFLQEGGFMASEIAVADTTLDVLIAEKFGGKVTRDGGDAVRGRFRVTIQRLDGSLEGVTHAR